MSESATDAPGPVRRAAAAMAGFPGPWALCGGWAVDAWVGRQTREHPDIDISVFHDEQLDVHRHFGAEWLLNGHDAADEDTTEPWDGRVLGHPAHVHAHGPGGLHLDIQLDRRAGDRFLLHLQPDLTLPLGRALQTSGWGVPTLAPEVVLFFKGLGEIRPHDAADAATLLPHLSAEDRAWLAAGLQLIAPDHEWLPLLDG